MRTKTMHGEREEPVLQLYQGKEPPGRIGAKQRGSDSALHSPGTSSMRSPTMCGEVKSKGVPRTEAMSPVGIATSFTCGAAEGRAQQFVWRSASQQGIRQSSSCSNGRLM